MLRHDRRAQKPVLPLLLALALGALVLPAVAQAGACPNEQFRTGRSASLPDCRAYELVTPEHLGRTEDMVFGESLDHALVSRDGDHLALEATGVFFEPAVDVTGTQAVFSRAGTEWTMQPIATPGPNEDVAPGAFSPDLSQVAFVSDGVLGFLSHSTAKLKVGPVGGPDSTLASSSGTGEEVSSTKISGANEGTPSVPADSDVVFRSFDHALVPAGPEREIAEQTESEAPDLYEWSGGPSCETQGSSCKLVNVDNEGKLLNTCGAELGFTDIRGNTLNAVSADGSRVFFTSPVRKGPGCLEPALYMRVDGRETVDVSEPEEGVSVPPSARSEVLYEGASADGSRVFFTTATVLTTDAGSGYHLYEYDTEAPEGHRLALIANEVGTTQQLTIDPGFVLSEDGSTVYYSGAGTIEVSGHSVFVSGIWRYDTLTGSRSFVAVPRQTVTADEPYYVTPNGDFFLFAAGDGGPNGGSPPVEFVGHGGLEPEMRGAGHEELYRYDALDGSVMCVSCGEGVAPAKGDLREPEPNTSTFEAGDIPNTVLSISDDGQRVFFGTTAKLVPQDTNEDSVAEEEENAGVKAAFGAGSDVYEWEADGTEEEPGVFCEVANGCTHLISAGEAVGPERFLGASASGDDVFFTSAARLLPQATPEFSNIYDARVDGGFPPAKRAVECLSCQGVGSPPPLFNTPASAAFVGDGNPTAVPASEAKSPPKSKKRFKAKRKKKRGEKRARGKKSSDARGREGTRAKGVRS